MFVDDFKLGFNAGNPWRDLMLTQISKQGADGKIDHFVNINWDDVAQENDGYGVRVVIDGDVRYFKADDSRFRIAVKAPETVQVSVRTRAADGGTPSAWCEPVTINVTKKGTGPAQATGLTWKRRPRGMRLRWDRCTDTDYKETAILRRRLVSDPWVEIDRVSGTTYLDDDEDLADGVNYKYKVVHYNRSDNAATDSAEANGNFELITLTDTSVNTLAAPTGISLSQANRDVDRDGSVDIALLSTFSGGVSGAAGYECEYSDSAGQTATVRADGGKLWFMANTQRTYRVRWRTISWNGQAGSWSSYSSSVAPAATTGAPAAPSIVSVTEDPLGYRVFWPAPTELDYAFSEVAIKSTSGTPSDSDIVHTTSARYATIYAPMATGYFSVRHVNSSGLKSGWYTTAASYSRDTVPGFLIDNDAITRAKLEAGAAGAAAINNLGTSGSGSVSVGPQTSTLLTLTFKCTSTTAGVTINLGGQSWTVDYKDGQPFTFTTVEPSGGTFNFSKSGGGTQSGVQLCAIGIN